MQYVVGSVAALSIAMASGAQVTITAVDRSIGASACVFAPPLYPEWCESDGGTNTFAGFWNDGASFGNSAAGEVGYGSSIAQATQESSLESNHFSVNGSVRVEVESAGDCGSNGSTNSTCSVTFTVNSPCRAVLSGFLNSPVTAELRITLRPVGGTLLYTYAGNFDASFDLAAGSYTYAASGLADGACGGACFHSELVNWQSEVRFEPLECPADLNGDNVVDDSDFVIFVAAYNELLCPDEPAACPGDLNGDGLVEDSDFVIFASAYNELLCP